MAFLFGFMGALAGLFIAFAMEAEGLGFLFGAVLGGLFGAWINLRDRVANHRDKPRRPTQSLQHDLFLGRFGALRAAADGCPWPRSPFCIRFLAW